MSFRDFTFLKEISGGSLKVSRRKGWFCIKGPLKYLLMPLLGKNQFAITLHVYVSIGPKLGNTHRGQIWSSS